MTTLTARLSKLRVRRTKIIKELQTIEKAHKEVETLIKASLGLTGTDSQGNKICGGDKVTTLTRGTYNKRIAKVTLVKPENHIAIEYLASKKLTWRKGHNLLKLKK